MTKTTHTFYAMTVIALGGLLQSGCATLPSNSYTMALNDTGSFDAPSHTMVISPDFALNTGY